MTFRRASIDVWKRSWEPDTTRRPTFGAPRAWYVIASAVRGKSSQYFISRAVEYERKISQ